MDSPQQHAAELVRAHLVALRGGAPFLSSTDARLLRHWLNGGVPTARILQGLDAAAEKRRARRMRTPLSLQHAKSFVEGAPKEPVKVGGPAALARHLAGIPGLEALAREAGACLSLEDAMAAVRRFHEQAWDQADRQALLAEADEELAPMRELVKPEQLSRLREEVARDRLRQRWPALDPSALWSVLTPAGPAAG